ncbi:MAG: amidohydrolase family protein, partial [Prevotella sp.]|nr:amidohydrolase family protein [Prevotella sp.]
MMTIIDAHSHLWLKQDTSWNGKEIRSLKNGRSIFLGEEVQMIPPFIIDSVNSAEVFLSNMDYAQVTAAVVVQELIDGNQNDYLIDVAQRYPDRFIVCGMFDYFG